MMKESRYRQISKIYDEYREHRNSSLVPRTIDFLWLSSEGFLSGWNDPDNVTGRDRQREVNRFLKETNLTVSEIKEWAENRSQEEIGNFPLHLSIG